MPPAISTARPILWRHLRLRDSVRVDAHRGGGWTEQVLHSFGSGTDGSAPWAGLIFDAAGNLYGTTLRAALTLSGCGTVFELTPTAGGGWTEQVLHRLLPERDHSDNEVQRRPCCAGFRKSGRGFPRADRRIWSAPVKFRAPPFVESGGRARVPPLRKVLLQVRGSWYL
jgi:uncharacterized repeat protein (TIGR03803 family)